MRRAFREKPDLSRKWKLTQLGRIHSAENNRKKIASRKAFYDRVGRRSPALTLIRTSAQYHEWRNAVMKRDTYSCVLCKSIQKLCVDHYPIAFSEIINILLKQVNIRALVSIALSSAILFDINNGRTLCLSCHRQTDTFGNRRSKRQSHVNNSQNSIQYINGDNEKTIHRKFVFTY